MFPDRGHEVGRKRKVKEDMGKGGAPQGEVCSTERLRDRFQETLCSRV